MPTDWAQFEAVDAPKVNWDEFEPAPENPRKVTPEEVHALAAKEPYGKLKAEPGYRPMGTLGPLEPQELLNVPEVAKIPGAALEPIATAANDLTSDFLNRVGIPAVPGKPLVDLPAVPNLTPGGLLLRSIAPETARSLEKGASEVASGFTEPGQIALLPAAAAFRPLGMLYGSSVAGDVPEAAASVAQAKTPEERGQALARLTADVGMAYGLTHGIPERAAEAIREVPIQPPPIPTPKAAESTITPGTPIKHPVVGQTFLVPRQLTTTSTPHDVDVTIESVSHAEPSRTGKARVEIKWSDGQSQVIQTGASEGVGGKTIDEAVQIAINSRRAKLKPSSPESPRVEPVRPPPIPAAKIPEGVRFRMEGTEDLSTRPTKPPKPVVPETVEEPAAPVTPTAQTTPTKEIQTWDDAVAALKERGKGNETKSQIQALFPELQLSNEAASGLAKEAFGENWKPGGQAPQKAPLLEPKPPLVEKGKAEPSAVPEATPTTEGQTLAGGAPAERVTEIKPESVVDESGVSAPSGKVTIPDVDVRQGDEIKWEPDETRAKRYGEIPVQGIVQDVIRNQEGEIGFQIFAPEKDDPTRVVRVWSNRGKVVSRKASQLAAPSSRGTESASEPSSAGRTPQRPKTVIEIADEIAARGIDPQASYGQFVKARDLKPEISAAEWLPIYRKSLELAKLNRQVEITKKAPKPAPEAPKVGETPAKEPWEMTSEEFGKTPGLPDAVKNDPIVQDASKQLAEVRKKYGNLAALGSGAKRTKAIKAEKSAEDALISATDAAYKAAHRSAVEQAIREGKPVPAEVLADYPDLAKKPTPPAAAAAKVEFEKGASVAQKEEALGHLVRDKILNAPSFGKLLAAAKSFQKSLGRTLRPDWEEFAKQQPWDLLSEHAGVMNAKSARAKTLKSLADAVIKEAGLPMEKPGRYRGQDYRIDWDKVNEQQPTPEPSNPPGGETGIVGMGGAVPGEFERNQGTATGIKNAIIDQERIKRGLPPAMEPARRSFGEVWDRAMAAIDKDPAIQDRLIEELRDKPRALTDLEDALLLHRQIDLQNEYAKSTRDLAQAFDDGRTDQVAELKNRVAEWSDKLQDLYDIGKAAGTETGRGLNARKMMAYEDFTLARLETATRAAKGGATLTDAERAHLAEVEKRYQETQKAYDEYVRQAQARIVELESKAQMAKIALESRSEPKLPEIIVRAAERIVKQLHSEAEAARARIKARAAATASGQRLTSGGIDPAQLDDYIIIGADHITTAGLDFAKWSANMIVEVGEAIKPHLDRIFKAAQEKIDRIGTSEAVKRAVKKLTPEEAKASFVKTIADKFAKGKKDEIPYYVRRLARLLYEGGIKEREPMVDALFKIVHEAIPEITRRQVMDAFSGYGDFKQLSKDQITVALRGMKGELQQLAKLEDMAAKKPPLKSGVERRTPTEAERQLIKLVNDAKVRFQVPVSDPATQLKSALDTLKTTLRNRIADYQDRLARRDFAPRPRREILLDRTAQELKAANERIKVQFQRELAKYRLSQRTTPQKMLDAFVKWERAFKLSSPVVFGKLFAAAMTRFATTAVEEVASGVLSHAPIISRVAQRAPREGGINVKAMAKALSEAFSVGIRDAKQTAKSGETDLDVLLGKKGGADPDWANLFGQLHGMMKAPVKRAEYTLSLEKRLAHAIRNGVDVTDPVVQMRLMAEALNDGYRSIFMQRGFTGDMFNSLVRMMEQSKKYPTTGYITARMMRFLFPVVRVPINIVSETFTGTHGFATASARTMFHTIRGTLDTLPPEVADSIMRQFKKGSIGLGLMAVGYFASESIGGYDWKEKRAPGSVKTAQFRIGGVDIPKWMTHAPWFELMQFGSTIHRVANEHIKGEDKGMSEGALAAGLGLLEETPFYGQMLRLARGSEGITQRNKYLGELARGTVVPQAVQKVAEVTDTGVPEGWKRSPKTIGQHIKFGIPGLRQDLPIKPQK